MTGEVTAGPITADVNADTGDIPGALNWGLMIYFEATHPDWAVSTDLLYMSLGHSAELPISGRVAEIEMQRLAAELAGLRRLASWAEVGIGGRVFFLPRAARACSQSQTEKKNAVA